MTSAVKATRNETAWAPHNQPPRLTGHGHGNGNGFNMGKIPQFINPNPKKINHDRRQFVNGGGGDHDVSPSFSHYVTFDIRGCTRPEIRSLKDRLKLELDRVRHLSSRIESGECFDSKKRSLPQPQPNPKRFASDSPPCRASEILMKQCSNVLVKLMKQKMGYVFNTPVDAAALGLHDYHSIIKNPMDLGTIRSNLSKNLYLTPEEFAADVKLTFNNALMYNPKGHEVHSLAQQFLVRFEQLFSPVHHKYLSEKKMEKDRHAMVENCRVRDRVDSVNEVQGSSWVKQDSPEKVVPKKPIVPKLVEPVEPPRRPTAPPPTPVPARAPTPPPILAPMPTPDVGLGSIPNPPPVVVPASEVKGNVGRGPSGKLPKPKAKDPNKRPMSMEEKHKLGAGLQTLPDEKMAHVIHIIRKRNEHLNQEGDEIELDMEAVDTETLWELDRFVTNYKKMASKIKRQALMGVPSNNVGDHSTPNEVGSASERVTETSKVKKSCGDVGEEDVDIGDEMPVNNFPPLEIERDDDGQLGGRVGGGASSSSSSSSGSSSGSSSSSDSDSGSSSGSDSDVDDAQSRDNESKNIHL